MGRLELSILQSLKVVWPMGGVMGRGGGGGVMQIGVAALGCAGRCVL